MNTFNSDNINPFEEKAAQRFQGTSKSRFENDPLFKELCLSRNHEPPTHLLIPRGQIYILDPFA